LPALLAKGRSEEAAERAVCAATESQASQHRCRQPRRRPCPASALRGGRAARAPRTPREGAGVPGCVPGDGGEYCCQKAHEPQSILRTDFEAHIVFIWMLLLKKSLACFLVKLFAEIFPLLLQLRPETDGSTHRASPCGTWARGEMGWGCSWLSKDLCKSPRWRWERASSRPGVPGTQGLPGLGGPGVPRLPAPAAGARKGQGVSGMPKHFWLCSPVQPCSRSCRGREKTFCGRRRSPGSCLSPHPLPPLRVPSGRARGEHSVAWPKLSLSVFAAAAVAKAHLKARGSWVHAEASSWASLMPARPHGDTRCVTHSEAAAVLHRNPVVSRGVW